MTGLPADAHIRRIALRVGDLDRLATWYGTVLGLTEHERTSDRYTVGTETRTLVVLENGADAPRRQPSGAGLFHLAIRVPTRGDLGSALRRIEKEWTLTGASDHGFSEAMYLRDPENNGIEVYRDRPRSAWPFDADGRLRAPSDPLDVTTVRSAGTDKHVLPAEADLGHVHLEVTAIERSIRWYRDLIGFDVRMRPAQDVAFLAAGEYHHHLALNTWNGRTDPAAGRGIAWFEIGLPSRDAVRAVRERCERADVTAGSISDGIAMADPDGIGVRCVHAP